MLKIAWNGKNNVLDKTGNGLKTAGDAFAVSYKNSRMAAAKESRPGPTEGIGSVQPAVGSGCGCINSALSAPDKFITSIA